MITDLRLQHFRSYQDDSFEFSPGVNIVVGPNASGKTNLLEAVLVVARGGSYRVKDAELIQFEEPWARLDAHLDTGSTRTVKVVNEPRPTKTYELNEKLYKRLTMAHTLPVVLFEPNHLQLLSGSPERRRNYLDDLLEQTTPGYGSTRLRYRRTLAQRNALLKRFSGDTAQVFPWNVRLSQLAGQIVRARHQLALQLNSTLPELYKNLSRAQTNVQTTYLSRWDPDAYETNMLRKLEVDFDLDRARGFTGAGPHREDMEVTFDCRPSSETASRGEARTAVLALKIIELQLIETARGITPLLLLDDVFSELDGGRRHALTDYLKSYQTFITTTDADLVLQHFTDECTIVAMQPKTT
jgi:DNA replication and repair protein RecF